MQLHEARHGFTFVEILVAASVLLVAFLGLVTVFYGGFSNVAEAGKATVAVAAAESMIELIKTQNTIGVPAQFPLDFNGVTTANGGAACPGPAQRLARCLDWVNVQVLNNPNLPGGAGNVTVTCVQNGTPPCPGPPTPLGIRFYTVTVTVSWVEAGRGGKSVRLVSGISDAPQ